MRVVGVALEALAEASTAADASRAKRPRGNPRAAVTGDARSALNGLVGSLGARTTAPSSVTRAVDALLAAPGIDDSTLVDLTHLPLVTIDNPDSKDLDQALFLEEDSRGNITIHYAIADASHFAPPGSELFEHALANGATLYSAVGATRMLDARISEGVASLNQDEDRRAVVFTITVDKLGNVTSDLQVQRARVRSRKKLSYVGVQAFLDGKAEPTWGEFAGSLKLLRAFGLAQLERAREQGLARADLPKPSATMVQPDGEKLKLELEPHYPVDDWNAAVSSLINARAGDVLRKLADKMGLPVIYRNLIGAQPEEVAAFAGFVDALISRFGLDPTVWRFEPTRESANTYLQRIRAAAKPELAEIIVRQASSLNGSARFELTCAGHAAIGVPAYVRVTAPMREVVGIFTHWLLLEALSGRPVDVPAELVNRVVEAANRASDWQGRIEREGVGIALDQLFGDELALPPSKRPTRVGRIRKLTPGRIVLTLDAPPYELKVPIETFASDRGLKVELAARGTEVHLLDEHGTRQRTLHVGECLTLRVRDYDPEVGLWRFDEASDLPTA